MENKDDHVLAAIQSQMKIPRNINAVLRLWGFSIFDIGALGMSLWLAFEIADKLNLVWKLKILLVLIFAIVAILLIMTTSLQPKVKNWRVLINVLTQDKKKYYPVEIARKGEDDVWK